MAAGALMGLRSGTLSTTTPVMELVYRAKVYRPSLAAGPGISPKEAFALKYTDVPCDVCPLKDDSVFAQAGQENIYTHVLHFPPGTDVQERDVVLIDSYHQFLGQITTKFELMTRVEPTESLSYVRCYGRSTQAMPGSA